MIEAQYYTQLTQALQMYKDIASNEKLLNSRDAEIKRVSAKLIYANLMKLEDFSEEVRKELPSEVEKLKNKCLEILSKG